MRLERTRVHFVAPVVAPPPRPGGAREIEFCGPSLESTPDSRSTYRAESEAGLKSGPLANATCYVFRFVLVLLRVILQRCHFHKDRAAPGGHSGRCRGATCWFLVNAKTLLSKTSGMGLESSPGAEINTKIHSKTRPTHLEGSRGPNSDPKLSDFPPAGRRPLQSPHASTMARPP
jgi:hypothetical protein